MTHADLVKRARKRADLIGEVLTDPPKPYPDASLIRELANTIEELERERDKVHAGIRSRYDQEDTDNIFAVNHFNDGMNEHLVPHTIQVADKLIKWADGFIFRTLLQNADEWAEERHRAERAESALTASQAKVERLEKALQKTTALLDMCREQVSSTLDGLMEASIPPTETIAERGLKIDQAKTFIDLLWDATSKARSALSPAQPDEVGKQT